MPAKVESTGGIARIILSGDFDFASQENLAESIDKALKLDGINEIHVDMTDATFIDSSVIRALLKLQESARLNNKALSIWNCNAQIRETFMIGGFDLLFIIH